MSSKLGIPDRPEREIKPNYFQTDCSKCTLRDYPKDCAKSGCEKALRKKK